MAEVRILRFPISGKENEYFLLEVSSNGPRPLDLKLIGSESTAVFTVKLRQKRIGDYKAPNSPCSEEEWEEILTSTLVNQQALSDIEIRADIEGDDSSVTLAFRKNIQGITKRLGSIPLEEDEKTEISPFEWCVAAIGARSKVEEDLVAATARIRALEGSLKELRDQLDEFIKTKEEDETQLLEKFRDLLNEKKVKIRQQQRLLASADVDPEKLANVGGDQNTEGHVAQASRASKRKIKEEPGSSDNEFEKMDVEEEGNDGRAEPDMEEDEGSTTEDETMSGTSTDDDELALPTAKPRKKQATVPKSSARASTSKKASTPRSSEDDEEAPPPQRNLPFMRNKPAAQARKPADDGETESDEDEL
ncbi:hypothetical protein AAE478_005989 [Parahypoxylon ruwenzoriense]